MSAHESWCEEQQAIYLYEVVAQAETDPARQRLFRALAEAAGGQAATWAEQLRREGAATPRYVPSVRTRLVAALVRRFGPRAMRPVLAAMKVRGMGVYDGPSAVPGHAMPSTLSDVGRRHKGTGAAGNLRAAVFGVNDGLVSNASLILGMAGAAPAPEVILLTGVAGLLAGAFSMASGEYVSVRSQRELHEYQIGLERAELAEYPQEEAAELALIYEAKGITREEARRLADTLIAEPERALDALAREELGLNPDELASPWGAALFSFLAFSIGAGVPLLPFVLLDGPRALAGTLVVTAAALFVVGAALSLFTGTGAWRGGLRMLGIGAAAGAATYGIGRLIGVSLA
jgi:VIT1/CCC1 family predicted Fe2+/Mn2+ transporter